jgi:hypothetical protein
MPQRPARPPFPTCSPSSSWRSPRASVPTIPWSHAEIATIAHSQGAPRSDTPPREVTADDPEPPPDVADYRRQLIGIRGIRVRQHPVIVAKIQEFAGLRDARAGSRRIRRVIRRQRRLR